MQIPDVTMLAHPGDTDNNPGTIEDCTGCGRRLFMREQPAPDSEGFANELGNWCSHQCFAAWLDDGNRDHLAVTWLERHMARIAGHASLTVATKEELLKPLGELYCLLARDGEYGD